MMISLFVVSCMEKKHPLVIGHRGAAGYETENTIPSIKKAIELGVDAIEIDVFKIKSGEIVVFHDANLKRLAGTDLNIEELTLAELEDIRLENGSRIPQLGEVLDVIDNRVRLNIELKGAGTARGVHKIVSDCINNGGWAYGSFIISSFKWDELKKIRELNNKIPIAVLISKNPLDALEVANTLKAEAINPNYKSLTALNVEIIRNNGFKIYPWTVNEAADIREMKDFEVDGIISDYPDRVKQDQEVLEPVL